MWRGWSYRDLQLLARGTNINCPTLKKSVISTDVIHSSAISALFWILLAQKYPKNAATSVQLALFIHNSAWNHAVWAHLGEAFGVGAQKSGLILAWNRTLDEDQGHFFQPRDLYGMGPQS